MLTRHRITPIESIEDKYTRLHFECAQLANEASQKIFDLPAPDSDDLSIRNVEDARRIRDCLRAVLEIIRGS